MKKSSYISLYLLGISLWVSSLVANIGIINNLWWKADSAGLIGYSLTHFFKDIW